MLEPYADALTIVKDASYKTTTEANEINSYFRRLNRIDNLDWIPPTILFLKNHKDNAGDVLRFLKKLERLTAFMHVCTKTREQRIVRYANLIEGLENIPNFNQSIDSIELSGEEKKSMLDVLAGDIYIDLTNTRRNYILLALDSFVSDGAASYDYSKLTIEHVLPQTVKTGSEWEKLFPDQEIRDKWVHKVANLVPLNRKRNSQAQNYDFEKKKSAYFKGSENVSSYALTTQVLNTPSWTEEVLEQRQKELLSVMSKNWELN